MKSSVFASALFAAVAFLVSPAMAGECPAGQVRPDTALNGPTMPKKVTDTVIGSIDLGQQYNVPGRLFRMRKLVVQPGGIVPEHSHGERPAHIFIVSGRITEHRSTCAVPIVHRAGDIAVERSNLTHWWKNVSKAPAVLISADILPPAGKPEQSM